jgi:protein tyrosine phosphatase (PTP) superfamily phosphohydrolase (DUF442 family)
VLNSSAKAAPAPLYQLATAGQPTVEQFSEIKAAGFETVINLALVTSTNALPNERTIANDLGMEYYHIPVEWERPKLENLTDFFEIVERCRGQSIFVHCAANMRVSAFIYLYHRLQRQMSHAEAIHYLHQIWSPNEIWQAFIDSAIAHASQI